MSKVWEGSLVNRLCEGNQFCEEITVGTGVTEYSYSDRDAYEVVAVKDQKHISIRRYDHKLVGDAYSNNWELISNEENPTIDIEKRGKKWYVKNTLTYDEWVEADKESKEGKFDHILWIAHSNFDIDKIKEDRKPQKRYMPMNISIGVADYYYDYSF